MDLVICIIHGNIMGTNDFLSCISWYS